MQSPAKIQQTQRFQLPPPEFPALEKREREIGRRRKKEIILRKKVGGEKNPSSVGSSFDLFFPFVFLPLPSAFGDRTPRLFYVFF